MGDLRRELKETKEELKTLRAEFAKALEVFDFMYFNISIILELLTKKKIATSEEIDEVAKEVSTKMNENMEKVAANAKQGAGKPNIQNDPYGKTTTGGDEKPDTEDSRIIIPKFMP